MWLLSPKTPHHLLLCGVLWHMSLRVVNPECSNFLDKKDSQFKSLHGTMDSHFHHLHATEVGWQTKHARVPTKDDEDKLWNSGVMGTRTPRAVQNAVFYVVGKMFSLRGGVEMRQVKISQIRRHARQICVHRACFKVQQWNVKKSCTLQTKLSQWSHVLKLMNAALCMFWTSMCFSKLPQEAFKQDILFVRPLEWSYQTMV